MRSPSKGHKKGEQRTQVELRGTPLFGVCVEEDNLAKKTKNGATREGTENPETVAFREPRGESGFLCRTGLGTWLDLVIWRPSVTLSVSGLSGSQIGLGQGVNIWKERKWLETGLTALSGRLAIIEEGSKGS